MSVATSEIDLATVAVAVVPGLLLLAVIVWRIASRGKLAELSATGARAWLVLGSGLSVAALTGASAAVSLAGLTSYDGINAAIPAISYLLLAWGLWRWLDGGSTLLRLAGLLIIAVLFGPPTLSFVDDTYAVDSLVRVALTLAAFSGPVLAALGSSPRPRRPGIDWTA